MKCSTTVSSLTGEGISEVWDNIQECHQTMLKSMQFHDHRKDQRITWMWDHVQEDLLNMLKKDTSIKYYIDDLENNVRLGVVSPNAAAQKLLCIFSKKYD